MAMKTIKQFNIFLNPHNDYYRQKNLILLPTDSNTEAQKRESHSKVFKWLPEHGWKKPSPETFNFLWRGIYLNLDLKNANVCMWGDEQDNWALRFSQSPLWKKHRLSLSRLKDFPLECIAISFSSVNSSIKMKIYKGQHNG